MNSFIDLLKIQMKDIGIDAKDLSDLTDIPKHVLQQYLDGTKKPNIQTQYRIANGIGIPHSCMNRPGILTREFIEDRLECARSIFK